jgi:nucleoside-diphosphate-sugar epimerase
VAGDPERALKRVLVTGASGFVGRCLCAVLAGRGYRVRAAIRSVTPATAGIAEQVIVDSLGANTDWGSALDGVDLVIHLAAQAHRLDATRNDEASFMRVNGLGTRRLVEASIAAGVSKLVYLSSIKVNGECTSGRAFSAADEPRPQDAYARSKWQGEQYTWQTAGNAIQAAIVRAPLVYGSGVRANFLRLMRWVDRRRPLPFGAVQNVRSMISVWNLADALVRVAEHPAAPSHVWMVSDDHDLSTPEVIRLIGELMGRPARLVSVPVGLLRLVGTLGGLRAEMDRLCGSLALDISATREQLDWVPPISVREGVARTVAWYLNRERSHAG